MRKIEREIDEIISTFSNREFTDLDFDVLKIAMIEFVNNGKTRKERSNIIEIIRNISWFYQKDINKWFVGKVNTLYDNSEDNMFVYKRKTKTNHGSSTENLIRALCNEGHIHEKEISTLDNFDYSDKHEYVIVDDFIGSGDSVNELIKGVLNEGVNENKIKIVVYVIMNEALDLLRKKYPEIPILYRYTDDEYTQKYNAEVAKYIEEICNKNTNENMSFGYNKSGSAIAINQQSPNNNVSLLWQDSIPYWNPLLNRDFNLARLKKSKERFYHNQHQIRDKYFKNKYIYSNITLEEFKFLFLVNSGLSIDKEFLKKTELFNTDKNVDEMINRLEAKKIIDKHLGLYYIADKVILKEIIELSSVSKSFMKKQNKLF